MSGGKKRSGFQITSVTSDYTQSSGEAPPPAQASSQSNPSPPSSSQSTASSQPGPFHQQGSTSQPTTPLSLRKCNSQDATGQGSRFRVVRLGQGHGEPYHRGRWTCTDFLEREEGLGLRRVIDSMRHAHSLESLEGIGLERGGAAGGLLGNVRALRTGHLVHSQGTSHLLAQPIGSDGERFGGLKPLLLHSGPSSPTHLDRLHLRLVNSTPPPPSPRPRNIPPPLRLDVDATGRWVEQQHDRNRQQDRAGNGPCKDPPDAGGQRGSGVAMGTDKRTIRKERPAGERELYPEKSERLTTATLRSCSSPSRIHTALLILSNCRKQE
uniref:TSC22 domain family protein 4 isoform X2 n=1 Tax=Oncorhynchus gorbuscha TaxID=8017 RepID=UPI001EAF5874|nr:TSC22 domain family protein 4 isoform X2 [Oncorhynchus gorbuscha]